MLINNPVITGSFTVNGTNFITNTPSTGSNTFNGNQIISGSAIVTGSLQVTGSVTTTGTITAQTLVVQTVTSSVVYSSGSNVFGNSLSNTQVMTGSVLITGSIGVGTVPATTIHLSTTNGLRLQYPGNTGFVQFTTDGTNAYIFSGYDGERVRITSGGNMGINEASPLGVLHARGTANADTLYRLEPTNNSYASKLLMSSRSSGDGGIRYGFSGGNNLDVFSYGDMRFYCGTSNISGTVGDLRMTILNNGVVDIPNRNLSKGSMPAGSVIQTVYYQLNSGFSTSSNTDQDTGLTASITPTSSTSKILIILSANLRATAGGGNCYVYGKLWRGAVSTGTALYDGYAMVGNYNSTDFRSIGNITYLDSPATTSSTTYRFSINASLTGTAVAVNSTTSPSSITLLEIAQ